MIILRRAGFAFLTVVAMASLAGCATVTEGRAMPDSEALAGAITGPGPTTTRSSIPGTTAASTPADVDLEVDVEPGDCVALGGTVDRATIDNADCGSRTSNYKVVDVVEFGDECAEDIDQTYYESFAGVEVGALCLDVDWAVGGCMDLGGEDPQRIDCSATAIEGVKVTEILTGTSDVNECSFSDSGYEYWERNFVVCSDLF